MAAGGRYKIEARLGVGGMGEVFRARLVGAEGFSRLVALKRMAPALSEDERFASMFISEARIAAMLAHPNIVAVFDFDRDDDGCLFLAMELVDGADLRRLLDLAERAAAPIPPALAAFSCAEVLRALAHAHDLTHEGKPLLIVHRDVSPHNVFLSRSGAVKLGDFGIAKASAAAMVSPSQAIKGKLCYMAPEQARGLALDGRADIYAVGIMLYELLTGTRPYEGQSAAETLAQVLRGGAVPPCGRAPGIPGDLSTLTMRLLATDRDDRPATAGEALAALRACACFPIDGEVKLARWVRGLLDERESPAREATETMADVAPMPSRIRLPRRFLAMLASLAVLSVAAAVVAWRLPARGSQPQLAPPVQKSAPRFPAVEEPTADPDRALTTSVPETVASLPVVTSSRVAKNESVPVAGILLVQATPWAHVEVDGEDWGPTPVRRPLPAGKHVVRMRNDELLRKDSRTVHIKPGREKRIDLDWK
ncbi:MAG: serine/threonine protein kinase [Deltaproteobacteria bacterium]|nr:serine/threonine protein kinase [Deltaproteobacteria bacterium]